MIKSTVGELVLEDLKRHEQRIWHCVINELYMSFGREIEPRLLYKLFAMRWLEWVEMN